MYVITVTQEMDKSYTNEKGILVDYQPMVEIFKQTVETLDMRKIAAAANNCLCVERKKK